MDTSQKQFVKSDLKAQSFKSTKDDLSKDDDDPLSIRHSSLSIFGLLLAFFTVFLPVFSILLERPLTNKEGDVTNKINKKDGY